jgi:hypothetical protein
LSQPSLEIEINTNPSGGNIQQIQEHQLVIHKELMEANSKISELQIMIADLKQQHAQPKPKIWPTPKSGKLNHNF